MTRGANIDILDGLSSSVAAKGPCALKTTGNVTLAGEQVIDGTLTAESRVLVGSQTSSAENGIYVTSTGDWRRAADYSRNDDVKNGTFVVVNGGATGVGLWKTTFTGVLEIDVTAITFTNFIDVAGYVSAADLVSALAAYQPLDSDLTAIAALTTTSYGRAFLALADAAAGRTALGLVIGTDVPSYANAAKLNVAQQTLAGGANVTPNDLGALSAAASNTITPNPGDRPIQLITNDHAGSILPGSNVGAYILNIVNASGAGALTTTGWTLKGDSFDTTSTSKFCCSCVVTANIKLMTIVKVA